ncbi:MULTISPECIES: TraR/DksA C4-type zinc finger protein [unclassified Pseudomonas]|uniref:TraR/DksA C4-type zinc finger protein n=1 Tax=unclassified Pseudomonas TaxID=196821 RepID=UPI002096FA63|nr:MULTISPECIES: TraR/DksA C4-type zinc finger protein [unclassified Pseudomonas]MCO7519162.1 TraR/DksA C4-type zinc finger protein [Pseudomonas sp. 1]MCO7540116.1 TraR/DksA C4-type zinc finger protein [Pseudomonas sp. VA159-2]
MIRSWPRSSIRCSGVSRGCWACTAVLSTSTRPLGGRTVGDVIDRANSQAQWHLDTALAAAADRRARVVRESLAGCIECDEPIPEARRVAEKGCVRCIECQEIHEGRRARYAR